MYAMSNLYSLPGALRTRPSLRGPHLSWEGLPLVASHAGHEGAIDPCVNSERLILLSSIAV